MRWPSSTASPSERGSARSGARRSRRTPAAAWLLAVPVVAAGLPPAAVAARRVVADRTAAVRHSAWERPRLRHPQTITIGPGAENLKLDPRRDYVLRCPARRLDLPWTLSVWGGHDVVLDRCDLHVTRNWVATFKDQSATLWLHGVHFAGTRLTGGIQLQEPAATVVMRDVLFDRVYGSAHTNHAELVQSWAGPRRLLIDGLTGSDTYQGLFLEPNQFDAPWTPHVYDLRHIDIDDTAGVYALWLGDVAGPMRTWNVSDVYVRASRPRSWLGWWSWPQPRGGRSIWSGARLGAPPGGPYVHAVPGAAVGVDQTTVPPALSGER